ncbi:MAG: iron ABC transporter permease [Campylobacterales bacterium]|nr:iron ABC transporter permease [Campylobacterales bacterium]
MYKIKIILLLVALFIVINASLFIGKYPISLHQYWLLFQNIFSATPVDFDQYETIRNIIKEIRLPRIVLALLIGASLAVAGSAFQAIFVNPLVSPGVLGVLSGASFGAALGILLGVSWFWINIFTFTFGFIAVSIALVISLIYAKRSDSMIMLVLGGIISSSLFGALLSIVKYTADPDDKLPAITYWLMGSLSYGDFSMIGWVATPMILGILGIISLSKYLNALSMGDEEAKALGVNIVAIKLSIIFLATLISALSVVMAGIIGWVGLIIPHITRMIFGAENTKVVFASALIGALFLLSVDSMARVLFSFEVPIGILTALIGIPIFIIALHNANRSIR